MRSLTQATPAYELSVDITAMAQGHSLRLISFVPMAQRPEDQVKFQGVFSTTELKSLRDALNQALAEEGAGQVKRRDSCGAPSRHSARRGDYPA